MLLARIVLVIVGCAASVAARAHGFAERYDLPVPLHLYIGGSAAAVALSFVVVAYFLRDNRSVSGYPTFNLLETRVGRALASRVIQASLQLFAVLLLALIIVAGFIGNADPFKNIAPTLVWVVWWVGLAYVSGLLGDLWAVVNPWRAAFDAFDWVWKKVRPDQGFGLSRPYPARLGYWPAVFLFAWFIWAELIWPASDTPAELAEIVITYSCITWAGMMIYGSREWLRHGEIFTVLFSMLARFAPTEFVAESREWNLRPWAVGLVPDKLLPASLTVFVLLMLSSVTFDGLLATPLWADIAQWMLLSDTLRPLISGLQDITGGPVAAISTIALIFFLVVFQLMYLAICGLMYIATPVRFRSEISVSKLARLFVLTLIPIALAYHLAHYLSFLLIVGQYTIPLASDPFGFGWDLFGTTTYSPDIGIVNAKFIWLTSVIAIVVGHIVAVWLAHVAALQRFGDSKAALRSQIPILFLMVAYTMLSLWILAQPVVETR